MLTHLNREWSPFVMALAVLGLLGLPLIATGCQSWVQPLAEREVQQELPWQAGSAVRVETGNGGIEVVRADPGVSIVRVEATMMSTSPQRVENAVLSAEFTDDQALDVRVDWPAGQRGNREGARIRVIVPEANGLFLTTTNGRIMSEGFAGEAVLQSSNGRIMIDGHDGPVRATTSNGAITVADCRGDAELRSSNGAITLTNAAAAVSVTTTNGAATVSLTDDSPGPVMIQTSNGAANLRLGTAFVGRLTLKTSNAAINTSLSGLDARTIDESSRRQRILQFADNEEQASSVTTTNGAINITKR